jgi:rhodanese-related sulfurtransferase
VIELTAAGRPPLAVDARTPSDYDASPLGLPRAVRLSLEDAEAGRIDLGAAPDQTIVVYCASPEEETSTRVAHVLRRRGLKNVRVLAGGIRSWMMAELPMESKSSLPAVSVEIYRALAARDVERRRVPAGKVIFDQGETGTEAYLVHSGMVEIRRHGDGADNRLTTVGEGDLFGELALFRDSPRPATAIAVTDVELLVLTARKVEWLMRNRPQLMFEILKRLSAMAGA